MNAIANAIREAVGQDFTTTDEELARFYANPPGSDPATDVVVAERDGVIIGYGRAASNQERDGRRVYEAMLFADPASLGSGRVRGAAGCRRGADPGHRRGSSGREKVFETFGGDQAPERDAAAPGTVATRRSGTPS